MSDTMNGSLIAPCAHVDSTGLVCGKSHDEHWRCGICKCMGFNYDTGNHPGVCNCGHLDSQHRLTSHAYHSLRNLASDDTDQLRATLTLCDYFARKALEGCCTPAEALQAIREVAEPHITPVTNDQVLVIDDSTAKS
jgi:hypothetical protein